MLRIFKCYGWLTALLLWVVPAFAQTASTASPYVDANGYPIYPKPNYGTGQQRELIERGEYLTKAGDCIACHSDPKRNGAPFAGGLGIKTPFGTFYTPNITGDKETGIGNWTNAQFIKAMQEGIAPDGSNYFPAFPYTSFTRVNADDLIAIKAYLLSLPPVHRVNTPHDVLFPFNWRFAQWGWKLLFFEWHKGVYQYDPSHSVVWNRGAYLVQGLGHCGECHSPRNFLGGIKHDYALTGAFVDGYYAPDITSKGLGDATIDNIVDVFLKGEMLRGAGKVQGPMAEVNYDSLRYLSKDDLRAIAIYLKSVQSKEPPKASGGGKVGPDTGRDIYEDHCAVCHGTGAAGAPKLGDVEAWTPRIAQGMDTVFTHAINGYNSMPPKGTCMSCSDDEIKAAVQYLVDQSKPGAGGASAPKLYVPTQPRLTLADGKLIYQQHCSVCHAQGKYGAPILGDKAAWAPLIDKNLDVLFYEAIHGHDQLPTKNNCATCSNAEIIAATKYMAQEGRASGSDYSLW